MSAFRKFSFALSTIAACLACMVPAASAAPTWILPAGLLNQAGESGQYGNHMNASSPNGTSLVAWTMGGTLPSAITQYSVRLPGESFTARQLLQQGPNPWLNCASYSCSQPSAVGFDSANTGYAILAGGDGAEFRPQVATLAAGTTTFGAVTNIANENGYTMTGAISSTGIQVAVWQRVSDSRLRYATRTGAGNWSAAADLSAGVGTSPWVAINANGDLAFIWREGTRTVKGAIQPVAGALVRTTISQTNTGVEPAGVVIDATGNATALWSRELVDGGMNFFMQQSTHPAGGAWSAAPASPGAADLSAGGALNYAGSKSVMLTLSSTGQVAASWGRDSGGSTFVTEVRTRETPAGAWEAADVFPATSFPKGLVIDGSGTTTLTLATNPGNNVSIRRRAAGSAIWTTHDTGRPTDGPVESATSVDDQGNLLFSYWNNGLSFIDGGGIDVSGPRLDVASFPSTAVVGTAFAYSAVPADTWSTDAGGSWDFGDGSAAGPLVGSKTYTAAGNYTATVTAADSLGHTSTRTFNITVTNPDGTSTPTPVAVAPTLSALRITPNAFAAAASGGPIKAAKKTAKVSYKLTAAGTTKFVVRRAMPGRKKGGKCVAPRPNNKRGKKCTRWVTVGSFNHAGAATTNTFTFTGRLKGKKLALGKYRFEVSAKNSAGSSKTVRASFTIKR